MSFILNIDTSLSHASICLAKNGEPVGLMKNNDQKDHARWLHPAVKDLLEINNVSTGDLSAIGVTIGPGSYTGLRVGLASAKGFCYALNIPLVTINTLQLFAFTAKENANDLIAPVIDARRMELYVAVYDREIREKISPYMLIIEPKSFTDLLAEHDIIFCGDGIDKLKSVIQHPNASFSSVIADASHLAPLTYSKFVNHDFSELASTEPLYVKEFYSPGH